jgi:hypothetical protein
MRPQKFSSKIVMSFLFFSFLTGVFSCNNEKKEPQNKVAEEQKTTPAAVVGAGRFYTLKLDATTLGVLFNSSNTNRLLLEFIDSNHTTNHPIGLVAYGARNNSVVTAGPLGLTPVTTIGLWDTTGVKILGNLELTRGQVRRILGLAGGGPIGGGQLRDLYFYPTRDSENHIIYMVSAAGPVKMTTLTDEFTNPSPPATPCNSIDCDN